MSMGAGPRRLAGVGPTEPVSLRLVTFLLRPVEYRGCLGWESLAIFHLESRLRPKYLGPKNSALKRHVFISCVSTKSTTRPPDFLISFTEKTLIFYLYPVSSAEKTMSTVSPPVARTRSYDLILRMAVGSPLPVYTTSSLRV
jgi:hypothetical protein